MTAVEWATRKIVFDEASAITGTFDIRKYRHLEKPLLDLDNIHIKRMTCIAASSSLKTVFLQIAMAYLLDQRPGSMQVAMQSDDDATDWMKTRGRKFLRRIPTLYDSLSNDKFATTNSLWMWPHQFLLVTGPGESAQQAKQVTYLFTDESHVTEFREGSLTSFEERMSKRWNRLALHVTTGADAGKEVDRFYYLGQQNEWHFRCAHCTKLFRPLWEQDAIEVYGQRVFLSAGDVESVMCPHCAAVHPDTARGRYSLHEYGDYVSMKFASGGVESRHAQSSDGENSKRGVAGNGKMHSASRCSDKAGDYSQTESSPDGVAGSDPSRTSQSGSSAPPTGNSLDNQSYKWTFAACHWLPWSQARSKYNEAIIAARLGNLKPHEDFQKKRLAKSYVPEMPELEQGSPSSDYLLSELTPEW